jgi:hypothetical protein
MNIAIRAGAGKSVIKINSEMLPLDRFASVHDDLYVRIIVIACDIKICLVSVEMTSLTDECIDSLKNIISKKTEINEENIWVCVSHSFSTPHILSAEQLKGFSKEDIKKTKLLMDALSSAVEDAVAEAVNLRKAVFRVARGFCDINCNRDIPSGEGWWIGLNPEGISDKTLYTLSFYDKNKNPIAVIYNYGVQSSIMDGVFDSKRQRVISSDLSGEASRRIESVLGEKAVAMFLPAASGDQAPKEKAVYKAAGDNGRLILKSGDDDGFRIISRLGGKFAASVLNCITNLSADEDILELKTNSIRVTCPGQKRLFDDFPKPSKNAVSIIEGEIETQVHLLQFGKNLAIIGIKPELNCITAIEIKRDSPFQYTLIVQMVNGGQKYMADRESYKRISYEAMNSFFGEGATEILCKSIRDKLNEIYA